MKLHLPKSLRSALLATFAVVSSFSSSVWAGWNCDGRTNGYAFYYDGGDNESRTFVDVFTLPTSGVTPNPVTKGYTDLYMGAGYKGTEGQISTFGKIVAGDGINLTITANPWQNAKFYSALTIEELEFGGGSGSGSFNVVNTFNGYTGTYDTQNVKLLKVSGMLTSITNEGNLTLGSVTINGDVTNSGTLNLVGTLRGQGKIVGDGIVSVDTSGKMTAFDGSFSYSYADGSVVSPSSGFIRGEQTFRVLAEDVSYNGVIYVTGSDSPVALSEGGYLTANFDSSTIFYVNDTWNYNADQSSGATSFEISESGTLNFAGGDLPSDGLIINSDGAVTMSAQTSMPDAVTINGGTFDNKGNKISGGKLVLNGLSSASISGDCALSGSIDLVNTYLTLGNDDTTDWGNDGMTIKIGAGSTLDVQSTRQSIMYGSIIEMAGGTLTGAGASNGNYVYGIDYFNSGRFNTSADSLIATNVGGHDGGNVQFDVNTGKTLTMTGNLVGKGTFSKTAGGTMVYKGSAFTQALTITGGVFEYYADVDTTHSGSISGSATLKKSGAGVLTLSGAVGSAEDYLGKLEVAAGKVALDTDAYISQTSGDGTLEILAGKTTTVSGKYSVLDTVVGNNAKLQFAGTGNDQIDYGKDNLKITLNGGTWDLGANRQSLGGGFELALNNGTVIGSNTSASSGDKLGGLDLIENKTGKIVSTGTSSITGGIRLRSDMEIDVQNGTLTVDSILNGNSKNKGITKKGDGTLVLTLTNSYKEALYVGTTTMEGGAIKYDISSDATYSGTITGTGNILKDGTGKLSIAKVDSLQGNITVSGGSISISELNVAHTMAVTGNVTLNSVSLEDVLVLEEYHENSSFYTTDGTEDGASANGFLVRDVDFYLFKGFEWSGTTTQGLTTDVTTSEGNTLVNKVYTSDIYYVNSGSVIFGGDNATAGTADAPAFVVKSGATLRVDGITSAMNMRNLLESVSGSGTLLINSSGLDTGNGTNHHLTTSFAGTLELAAGVTFTMGNGADGQYSEGAEINTDTLTGLVLNNGSTLQYNANGKTNIANVHVVDGAGATIYFKDSVDANSVQLTDKTLLDGALILSTKHNGGINIHHLVGDGSLKGGSGSGNFNTVISSLTFTDGEDVSTFSGSLEFTGNSNHVIVSTGTGADVELNKLSADGVASFAFNVQTDTSVELLNVSGGTVNLSEGVTLLLGDGTTETKHNIGTLNASEGSIIHLQDKATLNRVASVTGSTVTLTGSGVYDMGSTSAINVSGLTDAQNWTGTVKMTETHIGAFNPASYGNANSAVELCGVTTWMAENSQMASLLKLTKDGDKNGLTITDGSNWTHTFSGKVEGEGDFTVKNTGGGSPTFVFTGDLSAWKGAFREENASADKKVNLNLTGGGNLFANADAGVYMNQSVNGTLNFIIGNADVATTMNGSVINKGIGTLNMTVQGDTVFNAGVTTSKIDVATNGSATFNGAVVTGEVNVLADADATFNQEIITSEIDIAAGGEVVIANHWRRVSASSTDGSAGLLTGAGNLTLKASANATAENLTTTKFYVGDYSGVLDIQDNAFVKTYVIVNEEKSLKLDGSHNNGDAYIEVDLYNGSSVTTGITADGTKIGIDKLTVLGQAVFGADTSLETSNQGVAGVFDIGIMHSAADDAVYDNIIFRSNSNTSDITVFNLETVEYAGRITLQSTNTEDYRYAALNIGSDDDPESEEYEGIRYGLSDIELLTGASKTDQVVLGIVGDVKVQSFLGDDTDAYIVAGRVTETLADGETFKSTTDDFKNVYIYGLEGETPAVSSATIMSNINLTKLETETPSSQIFNGDTTAFNGTVDVRGGTLGFGTSSLSTAGTTVHDGQLQYADGAVTMTRLGEKDVVAEITEASFSKAEDGTVCIDGGTMKNTLLSIKEATSLELGSVHMYDNSQVAGHSADSHNKVTLNHTTLMMENLGEGTLETLQPDTMSAKGMMELGLIAGAKGISYTTDMFKDVDLTGLGYVAIGTLLADALLQHDYVALEFNQSYLDQNLKLITGVDIDPRLEGVFITTYIDTQAGRLYMSVPEPSTATLSLLALAALAARRRRK